MTENNILIALECCKDAELGNCLDCPYELNCVKNGVNILAVDVLNLINRQKAAIKELIDYIIDIENYHEERIEKLQEKLPLGISFSAEEG